MCACDHLTSFAVLNVSPLLDSLVLPIQAPPIQALSIQAPSIQALSIQAPPIQAPPIQALSIQAPPIQAPLIQAPPIQALSIQALSIHRHAHISSISHSSLTEVVNKVHYSLPSMQEPNGSFLSRYIRISFLLSSILLLLSLLTPGGCRRTDIRPPSVLHCSSSSHHCACDSCSACRAGRGGSCNCLCGLQVSGGLG